MSPDDAELVRVFTAETSSDIGDVTFPFDTGFDVRIDVEAGSALFGTAGAYKTGVVVRDVTQNNDILVTAVSGALGDANWPSQKHTFVFPVAAVGSARTDDQCEVRAFLTVRAINPDASFATSPTFLITTS